MKKTYTMLALLVLSVATLWGDTNARVWAWRSLNPKAAVVASEQTYAAQVGDAINAMKGNVRNGGNPMPAELRVPIIMRPEDNTYPNDGSGHAVRFALSVWSDEAMPLLLRTSWILSGNDSGGLFNAQGNLSGKVFRPNIYGIHYGADGVKGGDDDTHYFRGEPSSTLVHELHYAGIANPFRDSYEIVQSYFERNQAAHYSARYTVRGEGDTVVATTNAVHYLSGTVSTENVRSDGFVRSGVVELQRINVTAIQENIVGPGAFTLTVDVTPFRSDHVIAETDLVNVKLHIGELGIVGVSATAPDGMLAYTFAIPENVEIVDGATLDMRVSGLLTDTPLTGDTFEVSLQGHLTGRDSGIRIDTGVIPATTLTFFGEPRVFADHEGILIVGLSDAHRVEQTSGLQPPSWAPHEQEPENGTVHISVNTDEGQYYFRVVSDD